jgi:CheY-like chemotaxis protein
VCIAVIENGKEAAMREKTPYARILVADDNRDCADALAMLLADEGYSVRTAYDGHGALEAAREFRPDVVVLDIRMPLMTGFEAARAFRQHPDGERPLLIAITGVPGESDHFRATMSGFDYYLGKPVAPADIISVLQSRQ